MNKGVNLFVLLMTFVILGFSTLIGFKVYHQLEFNQQSNIIFQPKGTDSETNIRKTVSIPPESEAVKAYKAAKNKALKAAQFKRIDEDARIDQQRLHLVIAGGFHDVSKAQNHHLRLQELGYDSEIVQFKSSRLHIVCAGKFQDLTKAKNTAHSLQLNHQIEAYVQYPI